MADTIINVVTVTAPGRYAATAVARAVVSDALRLQAPSSIQLRPLLVMPAGLTWALARYRGCEPCAGQEHAEECRAAGFTRRPGPGRREEGGRGGRRMARPSPPAMYYGGRITVGLAASGKQ